MKFEPFFGEHFKNVVNGVERRESVHPGKQPSVFLVPMIVVVECRHGAQFGANLLPEEFPQLFAQLFPVAKRSCTTALAAISPTLSRFGRTCSWERKGYECNRRFPTTVRSRSLFTCV